MRWTVHGSGFVGGRQMRVDLVYFAAEQIATTDEIRFYDELRPNISTNDACFEDGFCRRN